MTGMRALWRIGTIAVVLTLALPVAAQQEEETTDTTGVSDTTVAGEVAPGAEPAVPAAEEPPAEELPDWTYRYLIPTLLALAALVVVATTIQYFMQVVRKRYRVVE